MYGIYANIGGILMVNVTIYIAYMDPMGKRINLQFGRVFQHVPSISNGEYQT
jgi:hypothetical protein